MLYVCYNAHLVMFSFALFTSQKVDRLMIAVYYIFFVWLQTVMVSHWYVLGFICLISLFFHFMHLHLSYLF